MRHHQHDVHDVNVSVSIDVIALIITSVPALAMPFISNKHDIRDIHNAVAIDVTKDGTVFIRTDVTA